MDPYIEKHERRNMKKMKAYADMLGYIADAQYENPTHCPCGVQEEVENLTKRVEKMTEEIAEHIWQKFGTSKD